MALRRACSYTATIKTPEPPENYSAILVTFAQDGTNIIQKDETQVTLDEASVIVNLNQSETKQFACGKKAFLQIRCYKSEYDAPGSPVYAIDVCPALDDEVLP